MSSARLRQYPKFDTEVQIFINEIMENFFEELSPLQRYVQKEAISEGDEHVFQRIDGSTDTMIFEEVSIPAVLHDNFIVDGDFDHLISVIYETAAGMASKVEQKMLTTVFDAAREQGNVFNANEMSMDVVAEMLERHPLTFDDEGKMDQMFVIPPELSSKFAEIFSDPKITSIIEKKRRDFFAKKSH